MRYAEVVVDALRDEDEVVLVGHSLGGITIPLVAAARPVRSLVYLCAFIPRPGMSLLEQFKDEPISPRGFAEEVRVDEFERSYWPDLESVARGMYPDCPLEVAEWAFPRLRHQARAPIRERCPLDALPDCPSAYVLVRADGVVSPEWSRRAAREQLGVTALELDGGHSPFLTRPAELAELLVGLSG